MNSANNFAMKNKRKTISAQDVYEAMNEMEYGEFVEPLQKNLEGSYCCFIHLGLVVGEPFWAFTKSFSAYKNNQKDKKEMNDKKKKEVSDERETELEKVEEAEEVSDGESEHEAEAWNRGCRQRLSAGPSVKYA